jgi:hypothetical protein
MRRYVKEILPTPTRAESPPTPPKIQVPESIQVGSLYFERQRTRRRPLKRDATGKYQTNFGVE